MSRLAAFAAIVLLATAAHAQTTGSVARVCPFTGTEFSGRIDLSGSKFCLRLDRKPIGMMGAPPAVPVCPDDGFVVYKEKFSAEELAALRPWVGSAEYRALTASETTYFRYAETLRRLRAPSDEVGWVLVQASWQVDREPERYQRYAAAAIAELAKAEGDTPQLLAAELERRTGQYDAARARLEKLHKRDGLSEGIRAAVERELEYTSEHDPSRHYVPADREEQCKSLD